MPHIAVHCQCLPLHSNWVVSISTRTVVIVILAAGRARRRRWRRRRDATHIQLDVAAGLVAVAASLWAVAATSVAVVRLDVPHVARMGRVQPVIARIAAPSAQALMAIMWDAWAQPLLTKRVAEGGLDACTGR